MIDIWKMPQTFFRGSYLFVHVRSVMNKHLANDWYIEKCHKLFFRGSYLYFHVRSLMNKHLANLKNQLHHTCPTIYIPNGMCRLFWSEWTLFYVDSFLGWLLYSILNHTMQQLKCWYLSTRHWNTGLVSSRVNLTSSGEGASLTLVSHPSVDGITIKIPYGVDVLLHWPALHLIFSYWVG